MAITFLRMYSNLTFVKISEHSNWGSPILWSYSICVHDERHVPFPCGDAQISNGSYWWIFTLVLQIWLDRSSTYLICCALGSTLKRIIILNPRLLGIKIIMNNSPVSWATTTTNANISRNILLPKPASY